MSSGTEPKAALRILHKKLGFRIFMDLIPLDATLVKGTHGAIPEDQDNWPILKIVKKEIL